MSDTATMEHLVESGTTMVQELWRNLAEFKSFKTEMKELLPDPESWKHPAKARDAVEAQLDWSERTLVRSTLDYLDAKRDALLATMTDTMAREQVAVQTKHGKKMVPFRTLVEDVFTDVRKSILRHDNAYFRQMRYFFEIQITGGQIPPFKMGSNEEAEAA